MVFVFCSLFISGGTLYGAMKHIYWTDQVGDGIYRATTAGAGATEIIDRVNPISVIVNPNLNKVYWTEGPDSPTPLYEASLTGLTPSVLSNNNASLTTGVPSLGYNTSTNRLYYGSWRRMNFIDSDGSNYTQASRGTQYNNGVSVDAVNSNIYYIRSGDIYCANLDLTGEISISTTTTGLASMTLDAASGKMYYSST